MDEIEEKEFGELIQKLKVTATTIDFFDQLPDIDDHTETKKLLEFGFDGLIEYKPDFERFAALKHLQKIESIGDHYTFDQFVASGS